MFFSHQFRPFSKNWSIFSKLFQSSWQNCILPDHRIILGTYLCFDKVFVCFFNDLWKLNGEITVFFSSKNNRKLCRSCLPRIQGATLQRIFSEKVLFFHHWALSDFCMSFRRNLVSPDVSTAFCLSIRSVCGEKSFV